MGLLGRASPGARLLAAIWMAVTLATVPLGSWAAAATAMVAFAGTCILVSPRLRAFLPLAAPAVGLVLFVSLPLTLTNPARGAWLVGRAVATALAAAVFASRFDELELSTALRTLHVPAALSSVLSTMLRQTAALRGEGKRLLLARELRGARGFRVGPDLLARLLVRTVRRAERTELAMQLRGYSPARVPRVPLRRTDALPLAIALLLGAAPHVAARVHL